MSTAVIDQRASEIERLTQDVQGWLHPTAGRALYEVTLKVSAPGAVVELGSWRGLSTIWMASAIKDRGVAPMVAVDTWQGTPTESLHAEMLAGYDPDQLFREFRTNLERAGVAEHVEPWRMTTRRAAERWDRGPIALLHIDAGHEYVDVLEDFEMWSPFIADGGYILFDDVPSWHGPSRLFSELPRWYRVAGAPPNKVAVQKLPG